MISVVDTGVANSASVLYALERLGYKGELTANPELIRKSQHVILPGVGTASACMEKLIDRGLDECLRGLSQPVLGICLGMQMLYSQSDEGNVECLKVFEGRVRKLVPPNHLPIPHMGWNRVSQVRKSRLLENIVDGTHFYFLHSFRVPEGSEIVAVSHYGEVVPAVVEQGNWFGTQFHPERSGAAGEQLLRNFLNL